MLIDYINSNMDVSIGHEHKKNCTEHKGNKHVTLINNDR